MFSKVGDKIVIFAIFSELAEKARIATKKMGLSIDVVEVDLGDYLEKAQEYKRLGKEIIIARGGIADILKSEVDLNIVKIGITGYDILNVLYKFKDHNKPIGLLAYGESLFSGARMIGDVLGLDIQSHNAESVDEASVLEGMQKIKKAGIDTVIGLSVGDDTVKLFNEQDIRYSVINSEEISIMEAIQNACSLYEMTLKEREKKERLQAVLDFSSEGIVSVDMSGKITTLNPKGEKILRLNERDIIGKYMDEIMPDIGISRILETGEIVSGKITNIDGIQIITDIIPILVGDEILGAVATFRKTRDVQEIEQKIRYKLAQKGLTAKYTFQSIKGSCDEIRQIVELSKTYSKMSSTVLITGETGTGKEVFAQAIHNASDKKNNAFVAINCSALPANLLESELFGYSDGAFTGARKGGKQGLFDLAHNGTIFLDEIGEMDKTLQSRLLRVIQEREIMRIGDDKVIPIDVRIIAATNRDLYEEVEKGNFRMDLYFRLNVLNLHIPPLRERSEDIEELVKELLYTLNKKLNCRVMGLDHHILKQLKEYDWPGNVRELQNVLEKIVVISKSGIAKIKDVEYILNQLPRKIVQTEQEDFYNYTLEEIEMKVILKVLQEENYNKTRAAERLGINRNTLNRKLSKGI